MPYATIISNIVSFCVTESLTHFFSLGTHPPHFPRRHPHPVEAGYPTPPPHHPRKFCEKSYDMYLTSIWRINRVNDMVLAKAAKVLYGEAKLAGD